LLLAQQDSHLTQAMQWSLSLSKEEHAPTVISTHIAKYGKVQLLTPIAIAQALFQKWGSGAHYILHYGTMEEQHALLEACIKEDCFQLQYADLQTFPPALFDYPDLKAIDLSHNHIRSIPAKINTFQQLEVLRLSQNHLKKITKRILELPELKELYLDGNLMNELPDYIGDLSSLEKLDITAMTNANMYIGVELPPKLQQLKKLRAIGLANYAKQGQAPAYYSPYRNYPTISWLESQTAQALNLAPLELAKTAFEQQGEAVAYLLRYCDDPIFLTKVLASFYDPATKTMDFKGCYLEYLPVALTHFDIHHLCLDGCQIGLLGSYFTKEEELEKGHTIIDQERLAVISQLSNLQSLSLQHCSLTALPKGLERLEQLNYLNCQHNFLKKIPKALGELSALQTLLLYQAVSAHESIELPQSFKGLQQLKEFSLYFYQMNPILYQEQLLALLPANCILNLQP